MRDSKEFTLRSNDKIDILIGVDKAERAASAYSPNISHLDKAEPWTWATDEDGSITDDNGEDYIARMPDGSHVRWENRERRYSEVDAARFSEI